MASIFSFYMSHFR